MNFFYGLIVGLIVGWVIEWIIDWLFWRRGDQQLAEKLAKVEAENRRLEAKIAEDEENLKKLETIERDIAACQEQLKDAELTIDQLRDELNKQASPVPQKVERLERIRGIGAVFARRLREAGINTFAQLAELTPDQIEEIVQVEEWQKIEPEQWIAEAKEFAEAQSSAKGG